MAQTSTVQPPNISFDRDDEEFMLAQYAWINEQMLGTAHEPILLSDFDDMMAQQPPKQLTRDTAEPNTLEISPRKLRYSCLHRTLEIYPDISHSYVKKLWDDNTIAADADGDERYFAILEYITSQATYPKEKDKQKEKTDPAKPITLKVSDKPPWEYIHVGLYLLSKEFPEVSMSCIKSTLNSGALRISDAFSRLASQKAQGTLPKEKAGKLKQKAILTSPPKLLEEDVLGPWLEYATTEFNTAREQHAEKALETARAAAEKLNEEEALASGAITECGCCFTDSPLNRTITCASDTPHHFCFECATSLVKNEIGSRKCRPVCMDTSGCAAAFTESQLRLCLTEKMLGHLLRLQQQEDVKAAGIDGLEECPFCDYMAICAPKEVDREFVCGNPDCGQTSCRLCSAPTHVPKTCAEAKADEKVNARHTIEEAMTEALVRVCNTANCGTRFVKLDGCNKMTCHKCGAFQCYICKQTITGYEHFGNGPGRCPQAQDDAALEVLYAAQVKKAEEEARAKVQAETGIAGEELAIEVSEMVKKDEEDAKKGAHADLRGLGHLFGDRLAAMQQAQLQDLQRLNQQIEDGRRQLGARPQALQGPEFDGFYGPLPMLDFQMPAMPPAWYDPDQAIAQGQAGVPRNLHNPFDQGFHNTIYAHGQPARDPAFPNYVPYMAQQPQPAQAPVNPFVVNFAPIVPIPAFAGPAAGLAYPQFQAQQNPVRHGPVALDLLRRQNQLIQTRLEREQRVAQMAAQRRKQRRTPHAGGMNAEQHATRTGATAAQPAPPNPPPAPVIQPQHNFAGPVHRRQADEFFDLTEIDLAFPDVPEQLGAAGNNARRAFGGSEFGLPGQMNQAVRWQDFNMVPQPGHVRNGQAGGVHNTIVDHVPAGAPAHAARNEPRGIATASRRGNQAEPIEID